MSIRNLVVLKGRCEAINHREFPRRIELILSTQDPFFNKKTTERDIQVNYHKIWVFGTELAKYVDEYIKRNSLLILEGHLQNKQKIPENVVQSPYIDEVDYTSIVVLHNFEIITEK